MATKKQEEAAATAAAENAAPADQAGLTAAEAQAQTGAETTAPADPAPATTFDNPSGAIMEPEIAAAVDLSHESVDANPRAGTTSTQNNIDWNDAKRAKPGDEDFAGQGLDETVYGKGSND